jgi:hypothetical protein
MARAVVAAEQVADLQRRVEKKILGSQAQYLNSCQLQPSFPCQVARRNRGIDGDSMFIIATRMAHVVSSSLVFPEWLELHYDILALLSIRANGVNSVF